MLDYYVYALLDSSKPGKYKYGRYIFDYLPFYIGKGRLNRISNTLYDKTKFKRNKIDKLIKSNTKILSVKILQHLSNSLAMKYEIEIISLIGRRDMGLGPLVNMTNGGDGRLESKHSIETKLKISKSRKNRGVGWKHNKETLRIMSQRQSGKNNGFYGNKHTDSVKYKQSIRVSGLSHPMYGVKHNEKTLEILKEHRRNISNYKIKEACQKFNKPVLMYDLDFKFLKEFDSVKSASLFTSINESIISKCCRGDIKNPTRYFFKYRDKIDNIKMNKFLLKVGDLFIVDNKKYKLIKRNKMTCICEHVDNLITLHKNDHPILFEKESNNIEFIELYNYIKKLDNSFKNRNNIIYNDDINIEYVKSKQLEILPDSNIIIFESDWIDYKDIIKSNLRFHIHLHLGLIHLDQIQNPI